MPLGIVTAVAVMMVWPIHRVRFHRVTALRVGHLLVTPDLMIRERNLGEGCLAESGTVVFYANPPISNRTVWHSYRRQLTSWPYALAEVTVRWLRAFGWSTRCEVGQVGRLTDYLGVRPRTHPSLVLPRRADTRGASLLRSRGLLRKPLACLQVRDSAFHPWASYRDAEVQDFLPAVHYLLDEGYAVIRMGIRTHRRIPVRDPRVIDLCHDNLTSDDIDLFCARNAASWLTTSSGIDGAAYVYGTPQLIVSYPLHPRVLSYLDFTPTIVLPRRVVHRGTGKNASLAEMRDFISSREGNTEWE